MARTFSEIHPSYNAMSYGLEGFCRALTGMNTTTADPNIKSCLLFASTSDSESTIESAFEGANIAGGSTDPGLQGDQINRGLKGEVSKFEGTNGKWYSNIMTNGLGWNMQFKKYETCPKDEDMFISGMSIIDSSKMGNAFDSRILIVSTPTPIRECEGHSTVCLGGGNLHISFDGGHTFVSQPGDYHPTPGSRLIAHNTFGACSREWFDYESTKEKENAAANLRRKRSLHEIKPLEFLTDKTSTMIDPIECGVWVQDRKEKEDLFNQRGLWSTIYVETPNASFHIEFRQSNPEKLDRVCDFQSLDAWMTKVSDELENQEWSGVLGKTKRAKYHPVSKRQIEINQSQLLRRKNDSDYEVDGPFGLAHAALGYKKI
eukprot:CAMPEP_0194132130 /NCGR_PEP_ID=MMETSP0152-20130528/2672_1 /TAXON_ID=1049557 /ORGANISM="Thalassiothrix antarctica, Strain L6-D1" /LENGTH=373 /DNA_ID=CAMNT_0038827077 /DNA_START=155 /DNA_END=1276 /DNA_ORIENTATION=-